MGVKTFGTVLSMHGTNTPRLTTRCRRVAAANRDRFEQQNTRHPIDKKAKQNKKLMLYQVFINK